MKLRVEVVCISDDGQEHRGDVFEMERRQLAMETLGLNLCESKAMLESVQDFVVARQTAEDLERRRHCPACGSRYRSKGGGKINVKRKLSFPDLNARLCIAGFSFFRRNATLYW